MKEELDWNICQITTTELLKLAMETEEGRKERLKKMVVNH